MKDANFYHQMLHLLLTYYCSYRASIITSNFYLSFSLFYHFYR